MPNRSDFISKFRQETTQLIATTDTLQSLMTEYEKLDYERILSDKVPEGAVGDFVGSNQDITKDQLAGAMQAIGAILQGISEEDKKAIYAIKL